MRHGRGGTGSTASAAWSMGQRAACPSPRQEVPSNMRELVPVVLVDLELGTTSPQVVAGMWAEAFWNFRA